MTVVERGLEQKKIELRFTDPQLNLFLQKNLLPGEKLSELPEPRKEDLIQAAINIVVDPAARKPFHNFKEWAEIFRLKPDYSIAALFHRPYHSITRYFMSSILQHMEMPTAPVENNDCRFGPSSFLLRGEIASQVADVRVLSYDFSFGAFNNEGQLLAVFQYNSLTSLSKVEGSPVFEQYPQGKLWYSGQNAELKPFSRESLFLGGSDSIVSEGKQDQAVDYIGNNYQSWQENEYLRRCDIPLHSLTLRGQGLLFANLNNPDRRADMEKIADYSRGLPDVFRIFNLALAYTGSIAGVEDLYKKSCYSKLSQEDRKHGRNVYFDPPEGINAMTDGFFLLARSIDATAMMAERIHCNLASLNPPIAIEREEILRSVLKSIFDDISSGIEFDVAYCQDRNADILLIESFFKEIAGLAKRESIDLKHYLQQRQALKELMLRDPQFKKVAYNIMVSAGTLKEKPEKWWEVDRNTEEYDQRTGLDTIGLTKSYEKPLVVEFGPGSGIARNERQKQAGTTEFAIADAIYYDSEKEPIEVHPEGVIIGDFDSIKRIEAEQAEMIIGVRSTVFKQGEKWDEIAKEVPRVLKSGGVWIDDSIRELYGRGNRIEQFKRVMAEINNSQIQAGVIFGPGMEGEDFKEGVSVPLALVMAKGVSLDEKVRPHLKPGYELKDINEC